VKVKLCEEKLREQGVSALLNYFPQNISLKIKNGCTTRRTFSFELLLVCLFSFYLSTCAKCAISCTEKHKSIKKTTLKLVFIKSYKNVNKLCNQDSKKNFH
jgi:hypothetical protein